MFSKCDSNSKFTTISTLSFPFNRSIVFSLDYIYSGDVHIYNNLVVLFYTPAPFLRCPRRRSSRICGLISRRARPPHMHLGIPGDFFSDQLLLDIDIYYFKLPTVKLMLVNQTNVKSCYLQLSIYIYIYCLLRMYFFKCQRVVFGLSKPLFNTPKHFGNVQCSHRSQGRSPWMDRCRSSTIETLLEG